MRNRCIRVPERSRVKVERDILAIAGSWPKLEAHLAEHDAAKDKQIAELAAALEKTWRLLDQAASLGDPDGYKQLVDNGNTILAEHDAKVRAEAQRMPEQVRKDIGVLRAATGNIRRDPDDHYYVDFLGTLNLPIERILDWVEEVKP